MITLVAAVIFIILVVFVVILNLVVVATEMATFHCSRLFVLHVLFGARDFIF